MKKRMLCLLAGSVLLVGCSAPGMKELKALCEKDAGKWMEDYVYVDGYFYNYKGSSGENEYIRVAEDGFEYMEIYKESYGVADAIKDSGYFKLFRAEKDHPQCNEKFQRNLERKKSDFISEYCVAVKKIDYPESRYWYMVEDREWQLNNKEKSQIVRIESRVVDKLFDRTVGELIFYSLYPTPNHPLWYGSSIKCDKDRYFPENFNIHSVIKSK